MPAPLVEDLNTSQSDRGVDWLVGGVFAAAVLAIGVLSLNPFPVGALHDDAVYVMLAKSLATGHGFRYLNLPGEPFATHFPPGYPLFLAGLWRLMPEFPGNVVLFKAANAVLLVFGFLALRSLLFCRLGFARWTSAIVAFVAVVSVPMLFVSTLVLSETLFFTLAAACVVLGERVLEEEPRLGSLVVVGLLAGLAALVRTPGVALIGAVVVCLALRRRFRDAAIVGAVSAALLAPWLVWAGRHGRSVPDVLQGAYGSYTAWFGDALQQHGPRFALDVFALNSRLAAEVIGATVSVFSSTALNTLALVCLIPLAIVGLWIGWRRARVLTVFLALYAALVLIWPSPPARYVWGIWPFIVILLALAVHGLLMPRDADVRVRAARVAVLAAAVLPFVGYARYNASGYTHRTWLAIPQQGATMLRPLVNGIRKQVAPAAVVGSAAEAAVYLYTEHQTVPIYSFTPDELFRGSDPVVQANALATILRTYPLTVVVGSTPGHHSAIQRLAPAFPGSIAPVDSFPGAVIYRCDGCGPAAGADHSR